MKNLKTMKTLTLASDNELIRLFQSGSNEALEALVYRHKDKLFTSILMLVKDRYVAEDLFQKVFFQIIDLFKSNSYNEEVGFLSWATRIAYDLCVDHCENVKHPSTMTVAADGNILEVDNSIEESTESGVFQKQLHCSLPDWCNLLPQTEREVIVLRHFGNVSFKEIMAVTRCNINTVIGRMCNGLFFLKNMLEEKQVAF